MTASPAPSPSCPICQTAAAAKHGSSPYWMCPNCDGWFQHPLPPKAFECSGETDAEGASTGHQMSEADQAVNRGLAEQLLTTCLRGTPGTTLDIGSKYPFLAHCLKALGCNAYGMDNLTRVPEYARALDVPMLLADFEAIADANTWTAEWFPAKPKLVTMIHVFEHMYNPHEALRRLRSIVADDGVVFLRMPDHNVRGFERDLTPDHYQIHPFFHTLESVLELLAQTETTFAIRETRAMDGFGQRDYWLVPQRRRPIVTAGFIAKNETRDLPKAIRSLAGVVDRVVLVDTGSTDDTMAVAQATANEVGLSYRGETFTAASEKDANGDWKLWDFAAARNRYCEIIDGTNADYVLWMDSDDVLINPAALRRALYRADAQTFNVLIEQGQEPWPQHRMWKNGLGIRYEGACHEYPTIGGFVCHDTRAVVHHDAAPGAGENSNARNLRILQREFDKKPTPRGAFYLGMTHRDGGRFAEAIAPYAARIAMGPHYRDEWIFAHLYKGRCERAAGQPAAAVHTLLTGAAHAPTWSEFWMELAYMAMDGKKYYSAIGFAHLALRGTYNPEPIAPSALWRETNKYTDQPARTLSFAYERLNDLGNAIEWAERARELIGAPDKPWDEWIAKLEKKIGGEVETVHDDDCMMHPDHAFTDDRDVVVAILAKDKAHTLGLYLRCLHAQTFPKNKIHLYVRTNNNNDETATILQIWLNMHGSEYASVHFDQSDVTDRVERFGQHEWNGERFRVLGAIRQASLDYAREKGAHYFVADCDNFLLPHTLADLASAHRPIVAPLLRSDHGNGAYSNYHSSIDANGYFVNDDAYNRILNREAGWDRLVPVPVVHCTYFVQHNVLDKLTYNDGSERYEYVIFSDSARKARVPQFIDGRSNYGFITMAETAEDVRVPDDVAAVGTRTSDEAAAS